MSGANDKEYVAALLQARIEFVRSLRSQLDTENSVARRTTDQYAELVQEIVAEVVAEVHKEAKTGQVVSKEFQSREYKFPLARQAKGALDVFGQPDSLGLDQEVNCSNCDRKLAASRFASHLEKCLGRGRNAGRANNRRS